MIEIWLTMLLSAHLLCVNVASGGPVVGAWLDFRGARGDEEAAKGAVYLARWSLAGLLVGAGLGLAVGWLKWDADYQSLWLGRLGYKLHWAGVEWIFSLVLMIGWWLWLPGRAGGSCWAMAARSLVAVLAATNLLYHFPVLFAAAARLADAGETSGAKIGAAAFRRLMIAGETPALAIHVVLASVAVAGVMLLGYSLWQLRRGDEGEAAKFAGWGARWALVPSVLQLPVGLWTLLALPAAVQGQLMGSSTVGVVLFVSSVAAALWLMNELAQLSMGEFSPALVKRAMMAMLVTVGLMTAMQQQTRFRAGQAFVPALKVDR